MFNNIQNNKIKILIYILCALLAAILAVGTGWLVVTLCKEVPVEPSYISTKTESLTQDDYDIVEIVEPEDNKSEVSDVSSETKPEDKKDENTESKKPETNDKKPSKDNNKSVSVDTSALTKRKVKLSVKYLPQNPELPAGCEITALTTVLNHLGYNVSKLTMADKYLPQSNEIADFFKVYVGDPKSNGFGCFAQPIVDAANKYLKEQESNYTAVNLSGEKFENLLKKVQNGTPVIIWSTMYSQKSQDLLKAYVSNKWTIDGKTVEWLANEHCMVLIGYDIDRGVAIMSDPLRGIVEYNLETVKQRYLTIHSQCVILQASDTAPIIDGVTDGEQYFTTQYVTIDDENLKSVTLNGKKCKNKFYINGNVDATYTIVATDTAKNKTTVTITTKTIKSICDDIKELSESNVTSDNYDAVNSTRNVALAILTDYATKQEKTEIDNIITSCDSMLDKILTVENEYERISTAISDYDNELPLADDKAIIDSIAADIDILLGSNNLTQAQRTALEGFKSRCAELIALIPPEDEKPPQEDEPPISKPNSPEDSESDVSSNDSSDASIGTDSDVNESTDSMPTDEIESEESQEQGSGNDTNADDAIDDNTRNTADTTSQLNG